MEISILFLLPLLLTLTDGLIHAPYQVGIYLFDNYNPSFGANNFAICSAAIVHPLFCVTTADCVHAHITSQTIPRPFLPAAIYIKSGNFSEIRENIKYVRSILIHPDFNSTTFKNNIAIIQVESFFQFGNTYNEHWVQISNDYTRYDACIYSINSATTNVYPFGEHKQTKVVNNSFCLGNDYLSQVSSIHLCSFYEFDHSFMCQIPEEQLRLSRDRGTPLICDNKLAGLLSVILPANVTNSTGVCSKTLRTYAYYTNISMYDKWIHSIIAVNAPAHSADGKPIPIIPISPPFQNGLTIRPPGSSTASAITNVPIMIISTSFIIWTRNYILSRVFAL